jgi:hypothetical protein
VERAPEELAAQGHSSIVFAVEDEEQANYLLREVKSLAAFGRSVFLRRFADRPPVIQCKKCQDYDHYSTACEATKQACRLCGEDHTETEHRANCATCLTEKENGAMETDNTLCMHNLRCKHCKGKGSDDHPSDSRRCPVRLAKYGSARANDHSTKDSRPKDEGWQKAPIGRKRTTAQTDRRDTPPHQNRFGALDPDMINRIVTTARVSNEVATAALNAKTGQYGSS